MSRVKLLKSLGSAQVRSRPVREGMKYAVFEPDRPGFAVDQHCAEPRRRQAVSANSESEISVVVPAMEKSAAEVENAESLPKFFGCAWTVYTVLDRKESKKGDCTGSLQAGENSSRLLQAAKFGNGTLIALAEIGMKRPKGFNSLVVIAGIISGRRVHLDNLNCP